MTHKAAVSLQLPNTQELCSISCRVNPEEMQNPIIKSLYHCQILTCRLLIDTVRCCIAAPSVQNVTDLVHLIVSKKFYLSGKLQKHLNSLKIQFAEPESVHPKIYEACLRYTITFKIASFWQSIGKSYFIHGSNFTFQSNIEAIEWDILLKEDNTRLELTPMNLKFFSLNLEFLGVPTSIIENFTKKNSSMNSINLTSLHCPTVFVLPKLTRGKVVSVYKTLPKCCPFNNYDELRRHWKNMYSYRLPKTHENMLFYEVVFSANPNQPFTYPEVCIFSKMPEIRLCINKNEVAKRFIMDLHNNIKSVCGTPMKIKKLHSQLEMEYSCTINSIFQGEQSFGGNEATSSFFRTANDCVKRPSREKLNLIPSTFSFKGIDKMNPEMKKHTQQILSIMAPKKNNKKKAALKENNENDDLYVKMSNARSKKPKIFGSFSSDDFSSTPPQKTIIHNFDDICSYFDIPSMRSEYVKSMIETHNEHVCKENNGFPLDFTADNLIKTTEPTSANDSFKQKPRIKSIDNVCLDLPGIKTKVKIPHNHLDSLKEAVPEAEERSEFDESSGQQNQQNNSLEDIFLYGTPKNDNPKNQNFIKPPSDMRSFLSNFDEYNIYNKNKNELETTIYNQCDNDPSSCMKKSRSSHQQFHKSTEEVCHQNNDNDFSMNDSTELSPSLLAEIEMRGDENLTFIENLKNITNYHGPSFSNSYQQKISPFKMKASELMINRENIKNETNKSQVDKSDVINSQQCSVSTSNKNNLNCRDPNKSKNSDRVSCSVGISNDSNKKILHNTYEDFNNHSLKESLQNKSLCKTPSMVSINTGMENFCTSQSTPKLSNNSLSLLNNNNNSLSSHSKINKPNETSDTAFDFQKYNSDFHSILSQLSNGSESSNHESYKLTCTEALTFDN